MKLVDASVEWQPSAAVWIASGLLAVAIGAAAAVTGPAITFALAAAAFGLVAGGWLFSTPFRGLLVYAFVLSLDAYVSTSLRVTTTQVLQVCIFAGWCGRRLLMMETDRSAVRLPVTTRRLGVALLIYLAASLSWSINVDASARTFLRTVAAILMAAFVVTTVRTNTQLRKLIVAMVSGAVVTAIYGYAQFARGGFDGFYQYFSPFYSTPFIARGGGFAVVATFANPNILAGYGVLVLPLAWSRVTESTGMKRLLWLGVSLVLAGLVLLTFSKASWLLVALLAGVWLLFQMSTGSRFALAGAIGIVLATGLFLIDPIINTFLYLFPNTREASVDSRLGLWGAALAAFWERPVLGFGLDGFAGATVGVRTGILADLIRAHNMYLQALVDIGILGSVLLWTTMVSVFADGVRVLRRATGDPRVQTHFCLLLSAASFLTFGMVETLNVSNQYVNTSWMVYGLLAASTRLMRETPPDAAGQ